MARRYTTNPAKVRFRYGTSRVTKWAQERGTRFADRAKRWAQKSMRYGRVDLGERSD